jgi:ketosteroid isomerase-like protein
MNCSPVLLLSLSAICAPAFLTSARARSDYVPATVEQQDTARARSEDPVLAELIALERLLFNAQEHGDRATLERLLADDFTWTDAGTHRKLNRAKFFSQVKADENIRDLKCQNHKIEFHGAIAVLSGDCEYVLNDFKHIREHFRDRWIKKDGEWQIVSGETLFLTNR